MSKKILYLCLTFCLAACGVDQMALNTQHSIPSSQGITSDGHKDPRLDDGQEESDRPYTDDHHPDVLGACCKPGLNSCQDLMNFSDCNPANGNYLWFPGDSCSDADVIERCEMEEDDDRHDDREKVCCEIDGFAAFMPASDCPDYGIIVADEKCEPQEEKVGACCAPDSSGALWCIEVSSSDCEEQAGYFYGDGTACTDAMVECPVYEDDDEKICCKDPNGNGPELSTASDCAAAGSTQVPDFYCEPQEEEEGACCVELDAPSGLWCVPHTATECEEQNGYFYGAGVACTEPQVECEPLVVEEICCMSKDYTTNTYVYGYAAADQCVLPFGMPVADAYCEPVHEETGACCNVDVPGGCIDNVTASDCEGAMFYPGDNCADLFANKICEPVEEEKVCCELPGGPQIVSASYCDANGGVLPMSYCEPVEETVCCELTSGYQTVLSSQCPTTNVVPDSYCESNEDPVGACCLWDNCSELTRHECEDQGGDYSGDGVSCSDVRCEEARPTGDEPTGSDDRKDDAIDQL